MKLVRLTSEDPNGIFKCDFNDGFAITPETKIALHSCSVGLDSGAIIIDNENNGIDYSVKAGFLTKILLDPFQYKLVKLVNIHQYGLLIMFSEEQQEEELGV